MTRNETFPTGLRTTLDGHDVERGFGTACPGCGRAFEPDDRLVVTAERASENGAWDVPSVVCSACGRRSFTDDERRPGVDQALVSVELAATPMALVIDGERADLLDQSPPTEA